MESAGKQPKPQANVSHHQSPFFDSDRETSFFFGESIQQEPFFNPSVVVPAVQAKLTVGAVDDRYEQEADQVATDVMDGKTSDIQPSAQPTGQEDDDLLMMPMAADAIQQMGGDDDDDDAPWGEPQGEPQTFEQEEDNLVQAKGRSGQTSDVSPDLETQIQSQQGKGQSLPDPTRAFMEPRFGQDFSSVKVHTDSTAVQLSQELGAQAFTHGQDIYFNSGKYNPGSIDGKTLLAHELTHTIQQTGRKQLKTNVNRKPKSETPKPIQAKALTNNIIPLKLKTLHRKPIEDESIQAKQLDNSVAKGYGSHQKPEYTKEKAILQPKTMDAVESVTASNKAALLHKKTEAAEIQEKDIQTQPLQAKSIETLPDQHISQSPHSLNRKLIQQKLVISSTAPISIQRAGGASWILRQVARLARRIPGFELLATLLGRNPITGAAVARTATSIVGGILKLIGKDELFQQLKESKAIEKAFAWFSKQIVKLNITWSVIRNLFTTAWDSLSTWDLLRPDKAFSRISTIFATPVKRIRNFAFSVIGKVGEFIFEGAMQLAGSAGQKVMGIIRQAGGVLGSIIKNPIGFVGNLVRAVKGGFQKFATNIGKHLQAGLMGWLFGALTGAGLTLPKKFNLKGIIDITLQVLGATYANLRQMLVKKLGEQKVARLEKAFEFVRLLATEGLAAAWQKIMEFAENLQDMIIGGIKNWVMKSVVGTAITKLITLFNPAGAVVQAVISIYNTIMFFVERAQQIAALASSVFKSIGKIAAGNVGAAIVFVEQTMARTLPVVISFLARQVGLGNVSGQIKKIIGKVQGVIQSSISKLVNFIVRRMKGPKGNEKPDEQNRENSHQEKSSSGLDISQPFTMSGEKHQLIAKTQKGKIKLIIASNPENLIPALQDAISEVRASSRTPKEKKKYTETLLLFLENAKNVQYEINDQENEILKGVKVNPKAQRDALIQATKSRLASIANSLQELAAHAGLKSLDDFYKEPPQERYIPETSQKEIGKFIRSKLYDQMHNWQATRDPIVAEEKPKIIEKVKDAQQRQDMEKWKQLKNDGLVEPGGAIGNYDPSTVRYAVDHIEPVSIRWNKQGRNSDDSERSSQLKERNNLRTVTARYNSAKGSEAEGSGRANYIPHVGLNFTSQIAGGGIKGSLKINGKYFLDAAGKALS